RRSLSPLRRDPPAPIRRRRMLDHVEAVARLWEEGQDAGLPLRAILNAVDERARARLGGAGAEKPFVRWIERVRPDLAPRTTEAWARAERLGGTPRPPPEEARRVC